MQTLMLILIFSVLFITLPIRADEAARPESVAPQEKQKPSQRAERPKRAAEKLAPGIHPSAPRPDESGKMRRVAPPRDKSPLQDVPALMEPPAGGEALKNH
jgi:hypothetical protein